MRVAKILQHSIYDLRKVVINKVGDEPSAVWIRRDEITAVFLESGLAYNQQIRRF